MLFMHNAQLKVCVAEAASLELKTNPTSRPSLAQLHRCTVFAWECSHQN